MVEHDLSWFPGEIKYQYFHCYSCEKAIFIGFIHHLYIFLNHTTVSISFQKLNSSKTKPWLNMVYHKLLGENVRSDVTLRLKHDLLIFYYLCLVPNRIRWYLSSRFAPNKKDIMISAHLTMVDNVPWSTLIQRPWSGTITTTLSTMVKHGWQWKTMVPWSSCRRGLLHCYFLQNVLRTAINY